MSSQHWNNKPGQRTTADVEEAVEFFMRVVALKSMFPKMLIENPVSIMSTRWRKPNQIVQPYQFGEDASKKTCFWTEGLPKLFIDPAWRCPGRWVTNPENGKLVERWANQTDSGQNRLGPSAERSANRAHTYPLIARQIALQYGGQVTA